MEKSGILQVMLPAAFIVIAPLIPAIILYKFLPSRTQVTGPFKGLKIDLSGAFAAYFLVALVLGGYISNESTSRRNEARQEIERLLATRVILWTVTGTLQVEGGSAEDLRNVDWVIRPPVPPVPASDGRFEIGNVPFLTDPAAGSTMLEVSRSPAFAATTLHFERDSVTIGSARFPLTYDSAHKTIHIVQPIQLRRVTAPYAPVGAALTIGDTARSSQ